MAAWKWIIATKTIFLSANDIIYVKKLIKIGVTTRDHAYAFFMNYIWSNINIEID